MMYRGMLIQVPTTNRSTKFIPIVIILSTNPCVTKAPAGVPYLELVFEIKLTPEAQTKN